MSKWFVRKGFNGITLWPFVVMREGGLKKNKRFINHEKIHLIQQGEMLVLLFYLWYAVEFLIRLFQYKNRYLAYVNISFEREAYANEKDLNYVEKRSFLRFLKYI